MALIFTLIYLMFFLGFISGMYKGAESAARDFKNGRINANWTGSKL